MPVIPLFNGGESVKAARISPPNLARTHQVVVNIADAARGFAPPSIPYQLADRRGGMAIGAALGQASNLFYQRAQKQAEALNIRHVAEADMAMDAAYSEFENWKLQNPDETKWEGEWSNRVERLRSTVFNDSLSPQATEDIDLRFNAFAQRSASNVSTSAIKTSFQKAGETLTAQALQAYDSGRFEEGDAIITDGVKRNFIAGDTAARMQISARNQAEAQGREKFSLQYEATMNDTTVPAVQRVEGARRLIETFPGFTETERKARLATFGLRVEAAKQEDDALLMAQIDPQRFLKEKDKFDKLDPSTIFKAESVAKETWAREGVKAFSDARDMIHLGKLNSGAQFDGEEFSMLTPIMRDILKVKNEEFHSKEKKAIRVALQNSPAIYENAVGVIAKYDPAKDKGGLQKAQIGAALELDFSGNYLEELKKRLDERGPTQPGQIDAAPALALIQEWTEGGGLGNYKVPLTQGGVPVMSEPKKIGTATAIGQTFLGIDWLNPDDSKDVMSEPKPVTSIDPMKQAQAAAKQATIRKTLEAEVKANKFKSNDEVLMRATELFQQHGGKAPAVMPQQTEGFEYLVPGQAGYDAAKAEMERAMKVINYKPSK